MTDDSLYIIYRWHRGGSGIMGIREQESPLAVVESMQREERRYGYQDGITWTVYSGGIAGALAASTKL